MKRIKSFIVILTSLLILFFPSLAWANEIASIDIKATIKNNGDMDVVQVWDLYADEDTEFYIPMQELGRMGLENFQVSMNGQAFSLEEDWDINASFENKAYKYGINDSEGYPELCFGISEYGDNVYTIEYTFTGAVQAFNEADGFNIRFVNDKMDPAPDRVSLEIGLEEGEITDEIADVWAFGYDGPVNFQDGKIVAGSDDFDYYSNMTLLASFEKGVLDPVQEGQGDFEDLKAQAMAGSDYDYGDDVDGTYGAGDYPANNTRSVSTFSLFSQPIFTTGLILVPLTIGLVRRRVSNERKKNRPQNLDLAKVDDGYYHRDAPLEGDLPAVHVFNSYNHEGKFEDLMSAFILKWLKEGALEIREAEKGWVFKRKQVELEFLAKPDFASSTEEELFSYMREAAKDDVLEENELKNYVGKNDTAYNRIQELAKDEGRTFAQDLGCFTRNEKGHLYLTEHGIQEIKNLEGYRNFLEDFTIINEREAIEVRLWDQILILAAVLGLAETVSNQFEQIYPDYSFAQASPGVDMPTLWYIHRINSLSQTAHSSYQSAQIQRSTGSGGSASFGGGGGFSGGGSGGGSR